MAGKYEKKLDYLSLRQGWLQPMYVTKIKFSQYIVGVSYRGQSFISKEHPTHDLAREDAAFQAYKFYKS
ncbi:hypothetical protein HI914_06716 [Erysiphe necator]|uniref:DRBM domain-containing protein n=1 Tax=Uncinula necator TaxID=52586 RepID=A0A0B1PBR7_UNCNE|nr:hypothetical protein HI914_06716 [Erysiphe necator]KHJ35693.1 hypothetical protein EV44_g4984 [Erysiphe necator]